MVETDKETSRGLMAILEQLSFVAEGLRAASDEAINNAEDGRLDALPVAGAARVLKDITERLNVCING